MKKIILIISILLFSLPVLAYDDKDWVEMDNESLEHIQYYKVTLTLRIVLGGSLKALQKAWQIQHPGTFLPDSTFCRSVAGGATIPEVWIRAKVKDEEVYPHISCFGNEVLHQLKKLGLYVVNPDRQPE